MIRGRYCCNRIQKIYLWRTYRCASPVHKRQEILSRALISSIFYASSTFVCFFPLLWFILYAKGKKCAVSYSDFVSLSCCRWQLATDIWFVLKFDIRSTFDEKTRLHMNKNRGNVRGWGDAKAPPHLWNSVLKIYMFYNIASKFTCFQAVSVNLHALKYDWYTIFIINHFTRSLRRPRKNFSITTILVIANNRGLRS